MPNHCAWPIFITMLCTPNYLILWFLTWAIFLTISWHWNIQYFMQSWWTATFQSCHSYTWLLLCGILAAFQSCHFLVGTMLAIVPTSKDSAPPGYRILGVTCCRLLGPFPKSTTVILGYFCWCAVNFYYCISIWSTIPYLNVPLIKILK